MDYRRLADWDSDVDYDRDETSDFDPRQPHVFGVGDATMSSSSDHQGGDTTSEDGGPMEASSDGAKASGDPQGDIPAQETPKPGGRLTAAQALDEDEERQRVADASAAPGPIGPTAQPKWAPFTAVTGQATPLPPSSSSEEEVKSATRPRNSSSDKEVSEVVRKVVTPSKAWLQGTSSEGESTGAGRPTSSEEETPGVTRTTVNPGQRWLQEIREAARPDARGRRNRERAQSGSSTSDTAGPPKRPRSAPPPSAKLSREYQGDTLPWGDIRQKIGPDARGMKRFEPADDLPNKRRASMPGTSPVPPADEAASRKRPAPGSRLVAAVDGLIDSASRERAERIRESVKRRRDEQ